MTKTTKIILYVVISIAAVGLLWLLFGSLAAFIGGLFATGGGRQALTQYAKADTEGREEADRIEMDRKTAAAEDEIKRRKAREAIRLAAARQAAKDDISISKAKTQAELRVIEQRAADDLMRTIAEPDDAGYARVGFVAILILVALSMMAIMGSPARGAHRAHRAHTTRILKAIRAAQAKIQSLRADLKHAKAAYRRDVGACQAQLANERKMSTAKIKALNTRACPPMWPHYVAAYGGSALLLGAGVALCWGVRR